MNEEKAREIAIRILDEFGRKKGVRLLYRKSSLTPFLFCCAEDAGVRPVGGVRGRVCPMERVKANRRDSRRNPRCLLESSRSCG
jgi:hypothetical protein